MDGHTYERKAVEKWFKSSKLSPRTGEEIETLIIPNINLKKIIQDMLNEGGAALYRYQLLHCFVEAYGNIIPN